LSYSKTSWKTWIKKITGKKEIWEYDDNIQKNKYNNMIRNEYKGKEPLFDIAEIESTRPDGTRAVFTKSGNNYYNLAEVYTYDEGHLNDLGRKVVADKLLLLVSSLK
jgi:hypothetical protein